MSQDNKAGIGIVSNSMIRYCEPTVVPDPTEKSKKSNQQQNEMEMKFPKPSAATLDANREIEDLLNEILPPRYWEADGKLWQQTVSPIPAAREDVQRLQDTLDVRLSKTQARDTGLCMVRHGIYAECFDEIIRQATINCTERGLLMLRIRDEMKMTLDACEILYVNAVDFGMRKAIRAAKEKQALTQRVKDLAGAHVAIEKVLEDTKKNFEQTQLRTAELYASEEKRFDEEIAFAKKANAQLKSQLEAITQRK